ncbi:MAG: DMT family transporter [Actinomycetota bacterium]
MTALIALVSALVFGTADFAGGLATRKDNTFRVTASAQIVGLATATVLVVIVGWDAIEVADAAGGMIAGAAGALALTCFYLALSTGVMSIVAPTTAVVGATIPAGVGIARGEDIGGWTLAGLLIAVLAIVLVSREPSDVGAEASTPRSAMLLAAVAGVGFAIFFIAMETTDEASGMWPLVFARLISIPIAAALAFRFADRRVVPVTRESRRLTVIAGVLDMSANALLLVALRRDALAIASVFGSLYPVSTVLLAWVLLRERLARSQLVGVALALGALALVAV